MGNEGLGKTFTRSKRESRGKGEERKRARYCCGSLLSHGGICNRMDEVFEGGLEWKVPDKCTSCWLVPLKSSCRIRFGIVGSIKTLRAEVGS